MRLRWATVVVSGGSTSPPPNSDRESGFRKRKATSIASQCLPAATVYAHHRKGNINPGASIEVVRRYEFVGENRVILNPVENSANKLTWERVN